MMKMTATTPMLRFGYETLGIQSSLWVCAKTLSQYFEFPLGQSVEYWIEVSTVERKEAVSFHFWDAVVRATGERGCYYLYPDAERWLLTHFPKTDTKQGQKLYVRLLFDDSKE